MGGLRGDEHAGEVRLEHLAPLVEAVALGRLADVGARVVDRMSSRPRRPAAPRPSRGRTPASRTSACTAAVWTPSPASSAATAVFLSWFRPATATDAPAAARAAAIARPMPLFAPVTSATLPVRLNIAPSSLRPWSVVVRRGSASFPRFRGSAANLPFGASFRPFDKRSGQSRRCRRLKPKPQWMIPLFRRNIAAPSSAQRLHSTLHEAARWRTELTSMTGTLSTPVGTPLPLPATGGAAADRHAADLHALVVERRPLDDADDLDEPAVELLHLVHHVLLAGQPERPLADVRAALNVGLARRTW